MMDLPWSPASSVTYGLALAVCVLLPLWMFSRGRKRYSPPEPPSPGLQLPVIGHLYLLGRDARSYMRKFRRQLGDVYRVQFGSRSIIFVAGYNVFKDAFKTNGDQFPLRPYFPLFTRIMRDMGISNSNGTAWKEHRRFTLKTLRDFGMGKSRLEGKLHEEAIGLRDEMETMKGQLFNPKEFISAHVSNIICSVSFGKSFKHSDERLKDMIARFEHNFKSAAGLGNFIPWLEYVPGDPVGLKTMLRNADAVFAYCNEIVNEHLATYDENNIDDLTSAYIHELRRLETSKEKTTMNLEYLAAVIADLFAAGSETTTTVLRWCLACLVIYPDIQEKLFREIDTHIGTSRLPTLQDKAVLKYVEAFYLEVMRYCNLTLFGLFRCSAEDIVLHGYTVPAGTPVTVDLDSIFTDKHLWGDPEIFRPERFFDDKGNLAKRDEFLAFFTGKRSCIGESLARMELFLFLTCLIQRLKFDSGDQEPLNMGAVDGEFGVVHGPKPYRLRATVRI